MTGIKLVNVEKYFGVKCILDKINLSIDEGQILSLLGPSGCGKSTTLKIIAGLLEEDGGEIFLGEDIVNKVSPEKRGAVIVFQDFLLFPHLNVQENIGFGLKMRGKDKRYIEEKVVQMVEMMELKGLEKKYPSKLSGGQKQRVALARALAVEPKVLLLDEPFTSLDINIRNSMREFVRNLQRRLNITTVLVTHDKEEALIMGDKIALIINGSIIQQGTPEEIYEKPNCKEVANFFGETNYIEGNIKSGIFNCDFGSFKVIGLERDRETVEALIKPEYIDFCEEKKEALALGRIVDKKYAGDRIYYVLECNGKRLKCIEDNWKNFKLGSEIYFTIDFSKVVYF